MTPREKHELDVLKQHLALGHVRKTCEVKRAILAWAYRRLLAERCIVRVQP